MVIDLGENQKLETLLKYKTLLLVVFYSNNCGYCKKLLPVLDEIEESGKYSDKLKIIKVDTTIHKDLSQSHNVGGIPHRVFYKDGKVVSTTKGFRERSGIESEIDEVLKNGKLTNNMMDAKPQQPQQQQNQGGCNGNCGGKDFSFDGEYTKNKTFLSKLFEESGKDPKHFINNLSSMLTGIMLLRDK